MCGSLSGRCNGCVVSWLTCELNVCLFAGWLFRSLADWLVGSLVRWVMWFVGLSLVDWFVGLFVGRLVNSLFRWLVGWSYGW